jgi:hypothetical protein
MHTIIVIAGGLVLLGVCLAVGRVLGAKRAAMARAALVFLPLWLAGAALNMWFGVAHAGYSVADEAPIFALVFGAPAAIALAVWWTLHG